MNRVVLVVCILLCLPLGINAQKKPPVTTSSLCTRENALDTTKQQILLTRTFDNQVHRIAVLIRAAEPNSLAGILLEKEGVHAA